MPMKSFPLPNIKPKPIAQNATDEAAKTMKFFARMLTAFFAWQSPLSTSAKPAFIQNTRKAVTSTHNVSSATLVSGSIAASARPGVAIMSANRNPVVTFRRIAPPLVR